MTPQNDNMLKMMKIAAGRAAADALVKSGMKLGLGTGSTAVHAIARVGEMLAAGELKDIAAFPTSFQSTIECEKWRIPFFPLNARELSGSLDLTIDGADEVDTSHFCVKGGGGALLIEKIAAYASAAWAIVVDESKLVPAIGQGIVFPVPVEVVPEARISAGMALEKLGASCALREAVRKAGPVVTDNGNLIIDIKFPAAPAAAAMEDEINRIPGVVENGIFTRIRPVLFIAHADGSIERRD